MKISEFREYLKIDKHALDDEIVKQPSLFYEVAEAASVAIGVRDSYKENLALIDAELDAELRKKDKQTEASIKSAIVRHQRHTEALANYLNAKLKAEKLAALKEAFKDRSFMLRELAGLYEANYYDTTSVKGTGSTDRVVYERQRQRIAAAREKRDD